jgi:LacI family transcriptional regulator
VKQGSFTYRSGLVASEQLLSGAERPSAIFASNDDMAAAAVSMAHRLHLEVPTQLSIAGFDDTPLATSIWPALTTVLQPVAEMARLATQLLLQEIQERREGRTLAPSQQIMKYELVMRDSTAAA